MNYGSFAFAVGMIASGVLTIVNRAFYSPWVPVPGFAKGQMWLALISGALMAVFGFGLLLKQSFDISARVLFWFLLAFLIVMKTPPLLAEWQVELHWLDYGQIATLVAGALALSAPTEKQVRWARYLLGAALIPIGLSHFFYLKIATPMVPAMLPYREGWVIFTGIAHIAAGLGLLTGIYAWLAATLEAGMLTAFGVLVWLFPLLGKLSDTNLWVEFIVTIAVASGAFAVASKLPRGANARL
jgi:uncharacterized membrane protein